MLCLGKEQKVSDKAQVLHAECLRLCPANRTSGGKDLRPRSWRTTAIKSLQQRPREADG